MVNENCTNSDSSRSNKVKSKFKTRNQEYILFTSLNNEVTRSRCSGKPSLPMHAPWKQIVISKKTII